MPEPRAAKFGPLLDRIMSARGRERRRESGEIPFDGESRWAFMRFMVLETPEGDLYLGRVRLVQTPAFSLYLHRLDVPDPGHDLHDHPWWFASLILRGGYDEMVSDIRYAGTWPEGEDRGYDRSWRAGSVHTIRQDQAHRIWRLHRSPTWALVLTGSRRRSWGFYAPGSFEQPGRFIDHRNYDFAVRRALIEEHQ